MLNSLLRRNFHSSQKALLYRISFISLIHNKINPGSVCCMWSSGNRDLVRTGLAMCGSKPHHQAMNETQCNFLSLARWVQGWRGGYLVTNCSAALSLPQFWKWQSLLGPSCLHSSQQKWRRDAEDRAQRRVPEATAVLHHMYCMSLFNLGLCLAAREAKTVFFILGNHVPSQTNHQSVICQLDDYWNSYSSPQLLLSILLSLLILPAHSSRLFSYVLWCQ